MQRKDVPMNSKQCNEYYCKKDHGACLPSGLISVIVVVS